MTTDIPFTEEDLIGCWNGQLVVFGFKGDPPQFFVGEIDGDWSYLKSDPDEPHIVEE